MPNRDGTGRLGRGKNCNSTAKADRAGRGGGRRGRGRRGRGKRFSDLAKRFFGG